MLVDFFSGSKGLFLPKGGAQRGEAAVQAYVAGGGGANSSGGGGRRCKLWPPGAGDPRYATACAWVLLHTNSRLVNPN